MIPMVTIVGRTNVGKSSLLNRLSGKRISIVEKVSGVTRDRVSTVLTFEDRTFELIDTGGIGLEKGEDLREEVENQISLAMEESSLILVVVDARAGVNPLDEVIAQKVREVGKPYLLIANKVDEYHQTGLADEFYSLGLDTDPICMSALTGRGQHDLVEKIIENINWEEYEDDLVQEEMKIAIVGRQNVGKSTFTNALLGEDRMIVSEIAGTTRDAVDVRFEKDGKSYVFIDTAGVKRKGKIKDSVEFYSYVRAEKAIARADVVIFMLDVSRKITRTDKKLGDMIRESHKATVLVGNKWDLAKDRIVTEEYADYLDKEMPGLGFAPIVFTTAETGKNKWSVIQLAQELFKQSQIRVGTGELNRVLQKATEIRRPPMKSGKKGKIFYATQVSVLPPTVVLFVNYKANFQQNYLRYLGNHMRRELPFEEIPIRIWVRERSQNQEQLVPQGRHKK